MLLSLYKAIGSLARPFVVGRLARGHEIGLDERKGRYCDEKLASLARTRPNVWIHAVSVGEVHAASPIVRAARADGWSGGGVVSTVTATGAQNVARTMRDLGVAHVYAPWDFAPYVEGACRAISPAVYAAIETEIWPALLDALRRRGVPRVLANARVSDRTWAKRARLGALYRAGYSMFDAILARSDEDAERLRSFGVGEKVKMIGDAKIDAMNAQREAAEREIPSLRRAISPDGATIVLAGSTHAGEDEVVLDAFDLLRAHVRGARLVIAPRHPERAASVLSLARERHTAELSSDIKDENEAKDALADVVVVDAIGVLYALYGVADCAFIGGSIARKGGQNILEPASWGVPIAHGPSMEDFASPTRELDAAGASACVRDARELAAFWRESISRGCVRATTPYFERNAGAAARIWREISSFIKEGARG